MAISRNYRAIYVENNIGYIFSTISFSNLITTKYKELRVTDTPITKEQIRNELAEITCKSPEAVKKWERGDNGPSDIQVVKDIAKYFSVDFHVLLTTTDYSKGKAVPEIYGTDEKSIVIQFYSILVDFIYDYVCTDNVCYAIKHLNQKLTTEDTDGYVYDLYRQLDKVAFSISEKTYNKLHRIITECKTLSDLGYPPVPYLSMWVSINERWRTLNPRLEIVGEYAHMDDYWDAKNYYDEAELNELMAPFRAEVGQIDLKSNGVPVKKEDFTFFDAYLLVPMELVKTLKLLFREEFADLLNATT